MQDLKGKVALVTGGGQGLGEAICRTLAEAGTIIIPADVQHEKAEQVAASIRSAGGKAMAMKLNVADEKQAEEVIKQVAAEFGKIDVLINNAGIDFTLPVEELTVEQFDKVLAVNLRGPFVMSKAVLPFMKQQGSGHIVNITSTAAKRAWANATAYHASKWGLLGMSHALHVEARPHGVKVTAVVNGGMQTPFILERFPDTPLDVLQDPKNVAETIRFILTQPKETVIPEVMVIPMRESSWP